MKWLRAWFRRHEIDADLDAELEHHRAMQQARGLGPREARQALGSPLYWKEEVRAAWGLTAIEHLFADIRFALRRLRKDAAFTSVAIVTLALGAGATTAIFSLLNGLLWRPLPIEQPDRLVRLVVTRLPPGERHWIDGRAVAPTERANISYAMLESLRQRARAFENVFASAGGGSIHVEYKGEPSQVRMQLVTGAMFQTLGLRPRLGRFFTPDDDQPGVTWRVVISDALWARLFQRDPAALGQTIIVDRVPMVVAGVAPPEFVGFTPGDVVDLWIPNMAAEAVFPLFPWRHDPSVQIMRPFARLRPGFDLARAQRTLDEISPAVMEDALDPKANEARRQHLRRMRLELRPASAGFSNMANSFRQPLLILLAAVGAVLLIAATNLTSLFLARNTARRQELAVRISLGAPASRLRREVFVECGVLALAGIALGWLTGQLLAHGLQRLVSNANFQVSINTSADYRVFALLACLLVAITLIAGAIPAWQAARVSTQVALKGPSRAASRFRGALIVLQTAGALVLGAGAATMTATLGELMNESTGYSSRVVFLWPDLLNAGIPRERMAAAYENILARLRQTPELENAAWTTIIPLSGALQSLTVNRPDLPEKDRWLFIMNVSDGYLSTVGLRLLAGRDLSPAVTREIDTALLSRAAAVRLYGSPEAAVGQLLPIAGATPLRIVGVAADAKYQDVRSTAPAVLYRPYYRSQNPGYPIAIRYRGGDASAIRAATRAFAQEAGRTPFVRVHTIEGSLRSLVSRERMLAWLLAAMAALAMLISATGLAGLLAYGVEQRRREFGIRLALGATVASVRRLILGDGLRLALTGLALGAVACYPLRHALDSFLYGIAPTDPRIWLAAVGTTLAAALLATAGPARRAGAVDPARILRND